MSFLKEDIKEGNTTDSLNELALKKISGIGANPNKFMGTRTNITFLGAGPTKNP